MSEAEHGRTEAHHVREGRNEERRVEEILEGRVEVLILSFAVFIRRLARPVAIEILVEKWSEKVPSDETTAPRYLSFSVQGISWLFTRRGGEDF